MKFSRESLRLYAVTDRTWLNGRSLGQVVEEAINGGATLIQLREKNLGYEAFKYQALEIQRLCRKYDVPFIVNDNVNLAMDINKMVQNLLKDYTKRWLIFRSHLFLCLNLNLLCHHHLKPYHHTYH